MNWLQSQALKLVLPFLVGLIAKFGVDWIKKGVTAIDNAPALVKQALAVALAFILTLVAHYVALPAGCAVTGTTVDVDACFGAFTNTDALGALLSGLIAIAIKHGETNQAKP